MSTNEDSRNLTFKNDIWFVNSLVETIFTEKKKRKKNLNEYNKLKFLGQNDDRFHNKYSKCIRKSPSKK